MLRIEWVRASLLLLGFGAWGCSIITNPDRFHRGDDGGSPDAQQSADAGDAGPCTDPVDETCNGDDDDCDGIVDEGFDLDTDPNSCGTCGRVCPSVPNSTPGCEAGECTPVCEAGFGDCDADYLTGCEVDLSSPDDCGSCGTTCASDEFCSSSGCVSDCPGAEAVCGRACVDTNASLMHCGACDNACPEAVNATRTCTAGTCGFTCDAGFDDCDGNPANGCETDLSTVFDCGSCGTVCSFPNGMAACTATGCELAGCNAGYADCTSDPGCESDLTTTTTCGACGTTCGPVANAVAFCSTTGCDFACNAGFDDCDGDATNGCEASLGTDATCGSCTTACSGATPVCSGGTCASGCTAPEERCSGACANTLTDPLHCGTCGNACPSAPGATPACMGGSCTFTCMPDFADCTAEPGCETSTRTVLSCGGCGSVCSVANGTPSCSTGTCAIASCDTGFADCNASVSDGCETNLRLPATCGSCGSSCTIAHGTPTCTTGTCAIASCDAGYQNCDGDVSNGCEAMLVRAYRDADGDGRGDASVSMLYCPGTIPSGWVLSSTDCDDTDASTYPMATELCDSRNNDCDGAVDEGWSIGMACSCVAGAASGSLRCSGPTATECAYPSEVCNALDDDCNGAPDNGFACVRASTRACTIAMGTCTATGTETCNGSCTGYGACTPIEVCDRADNTCDDFSDENQLTSGASSDVASMFTYAVRADYSPMRNEIGVVFRQSPSAGNYEAWFARTDTLGRLLGGPVLLGPCYAFALDIAWDGNHWTVATDNPSGDRIVFYRVEAGTDRVFPGPALAPVIAGNGFHTVALDRIGTANEVAVATGESGTSRARVTRVSAPASAATVAGIGPSAEPWSTPETGYAAGVAVTGHPGGAYVFWTRMYGSPLRHEIRYMSVTELGFGPTNAAFDDSDDKFQIEAAFDGTRNRVGFVFGRRTPSGTETRSFHTIDPATMAIGSALVLPLSRNTYISAANDDSFAIASGTSVTRYRPSDLAVIPGDAITAGTANIYAIEGVTNASAMTDGRYVVFGDGRIPATPVVCR